MERLTTITQGMIIKCFECEEKPYCHDETAMGGCEAVEKVLQKLKHYEDLEEQGLLLRTPCKLGDKFYRVNWNNEVEEYKVSCLTQKADGSFKIRVTRLRHGSVHDIIPKEIGETYFLTKEEAEAKLKELENESV